MDNTNTALIEPRGFQAATRLQIRAGQLPPGDARKALVKEIQKLTDEVNAILEKRDLIKMRIPRRPAGLREAEFDRLATLYAEKMMVIEVKHKELKEFEKDLKIIDPAQK